MSANEGSLVHELAAYEDTTELQALLADFPDAWDTDDDYLSDSPVGIAIDAGNLAALKLFVANGYDLDPVRWFDHPVRMFSPYTGRDTPDHIEMLAWILSQIELRRDLDTTLTLLEFAEHGRFDAVRILLEAGVDPNRWVMQWYSVWDLTDDAEVRELLESYGARSNFRKLIAYAGIALLLLLVVLYFVFKTKPTTSAAGEAQRPERNPKKGRILFRVGVSLFLFGSISALLFRYGSVLGISRAGLPGFAYVILLAVSGLGIRLVTQGRKLQAVDAEDIVRDRKRPIFLYLRSFKLDEQDAEQKVLLPGGLSVPINPWESALDAAFGKVGDLIGIGRPGEKLATTGAARLYVTDDEWQDKVVELVETCDLVIWTYGATEGLKWEIGRLVESIPPEKLVLAMPFSNIKGKDRQPMWQKARESLGSVLPQPLPPTVGHSLFVTFDENWSSSWAETEPPPWWKRIATLGFWNPIVNGARSLLISRGYEYPKLTLTERFAYALLALMGWVVLGVILVMAYGLFVAFS